MYLKAINILIDLWMNVSSVQQQLYNTVFSFQVITSEEAERRGQLYDNKGITYLFDLDYESDEFTVDAARYGNVSHFVNHSVRDTYYRQDQDHLLQTGQLVLF